MDSSVTELCRYYSEAGRRGDPLVLATTLRTEGSTYRKAGARILISRQGESSGLLSGGCMEVDLLERAAQVIETQRPQRVRFDSTGPEDLVWGLGLGCEGVTEVWLQPVVAANDHAPLPYICDCLRRESSGAVITVIGGEALPSELGRHGYSGVDAGDALSAQLGKLDVSAPAVRTVSYLGRTLEVFAAPVSLPPALLLCGGGPDAVPVARLADSLGWRVTVVDHRPAFAMAANFPATAKVILARAEELKEQVRTSRFDAAVIMSHQLASDVAYLGQLAEDPPRFIGLLGPASRRARVFDAVGAAAHAISDRIYGPVGLNIGANTPASIAVSIVAQIHAVLAGQHDAAFRPS